MDGDKYVRFDEEYPCLWRASHQTRTKVSIWCEKRKKFMGKRGCIKCLKEREK